MRREPFDADRGSTPDPSPTGQPAGEPAGAVAEPSAHSVSRRRFLAEAGAGAGSLAALAMLGAGIPSSVAAQSSGAVGTLPTTLVPGAGGTLPPAPGGTPSAARLRPAAAATVSPDLAAPVLTAGPGYRVDTNGWIYVHVEGDPYDRGFQHGQLVAPELATIMRTLRHIMPIDTGQKWDYFVAAAERLYVPHREDEFLQEIKGIATGATKAGTDISWQEVLAWNGNMELTGYWYPGVLSGAYSDGVDNTHCSAFVATGSYTKDGKPVMAHNNWDHFVTGQFANVILDIAPSSGHRMLMQAFPGYIASMTDYFVTDAGIMGTETTIGSYTGYDPKRMAEFYRMRKATQYADSLDDWVRLMKKVNNGGYANSWLLADTNTGEIVRFELGLKYQSVVRTGDGFYVGFNSAIDPRIRNLECGGDPTYFDTRTPAACRRVRLTQLMEEQRGKIDPEVAKAVLSDHYDIYLDKADNPCSRTIEGHYEIDPFTYWQARRPYSPQGALDGKVMDATMAKDMSFVARWGSSSGMPFDAAAYTAAHPQWDNVAGYLNDRPTQPWTLFRAG
ncbi:MAG: C45 family peptidase [Chloroflexota bacterium]